jgi:Signal transduction histidine kinase
MGKAEILFDVQEYANAKANAEMVLKTISKTTNQKLFLRACLIQGKYYFVKKEFDTAVNWFQQLYKESEASGNISFLRDASYHLSEIFKLKKQESLANDYTNKFRIYDEKLQNTDLTRQIERLQFLLQIENKEKENELLKSNEARNNSIIAKQRFQNLLLIIVVLSVGILAGVTFYNSRKRRLVNQKLAIQNRQIVQQRAEIEHQNEILSKRNQQLSDLNHEKDTLMNIVAHDLKSPLNRILGLARIMEMTGGLPDSQSEYLKMIKNATKSGSDLITDLLDVNSFAETGNSLKLTKVNLEELINEKINAVATAAETKKIEIELSYHFPYEFNTDGDYVGRIIDNLLTNAIKFSPYQAKIQINGAYEHQSVRLTIRDHGPGFSEDDKKSLFQKFKKLSARPTAGESSNGLGLAIVKTLVERLGGRIDLVSDQGKGSEFIVIIPESKN